MFFTKEICSFFILFGCFLKLLALSITWLTVANYPLPNRNRNRKPQPLGPTFGFFSFKFKLFLPKLKFFLATN